MTRPPGSLQPDALLHAALRAAPRRYRMPPLPVDAVAARAAGIETALAFAIEAARTGAAPQDAARSLFLDSLAALVARALAPDGGDPAFQALVLRARSAAVTSYLKLDAGIAATRRGVRRAVDALAHPGKLRTAPAGASRETLAHLHALLAADAWSGLLAHPALPATVRPALERLQHWQALRATPEVRQYLALSGQLGPAAGTAAAAAHGRASAQVGNVAEQATLRSFAAIAAALAASAGDGLRHRAIGGLLTPPGFPGAADKAKDEWDAAIVREAARGGPAEIVLLAEVKASASAAVPDFSRLVRGLERLALADPGTAYTFASDHGELRITGASLRRLQPADGELPSHVIYCCAADEVQPAPLSAATRAVLLGEPASVQLALDLLAQAPVDAQRLAPVWEALATAPRLRSALHQYRTAELARAAMLHPDDLLAAVLRRRAAF